VRRSLARTVAFVVAAVALLQAVPGCSWSEKIQVAANGAPQYQNVQISYDLAATSEINRSNQPPVIEQTANVELASNNPPTKPSRPWTPRRVHLEIHYPCPGAPPGFARATLRIETEKKQEAKKDNKLFPWAWSATTPTPEPKKAEVEPAALPAEDRADLVAADQVLYIDLPKPELDEVLTELSRADFFTRPSNPDGESRVRVTYDKGQCEKGWVRHERLDKLVDLLRSQGTPLPVPPVVSKKS
jgi:hypothetical protein